MGRQIRGRSRRTADTHQAPRLWRESLYRSAVRTRARSRVAPRVSGIPRIRGETARISPLELPSCRQSISQFPVNFSSTTAFIVDLRVGLAVELLLVGQRLTLRPTL